MSTMGTFKNKNNGEEVKITEVGDNFYKLSNGKQILQTKFLHHYIPVENKKLINQESKNNLNEKKINNESIDPESFFNNPNQYNDLVIKLTNKQQNVPQQQNDNNMNTIIKSSSEGIIMQEPPIEERIQQLRNNNAQLLDKYGNKEQNNVVDNKNNEEQQKLEDYKLLTGNNPNNMKQPTQSTQPKQQINSQNSQNTFLDNFMSKFKKNYDININLEVKEKIVEPTFLKMVADNVNDDILDWYANQFVDKLLYDPDILKDKIYKKLHIEVYGTLPKPKLEDEKENKTENLKTEKLNDISPSPLSIKKDEEENENEEGIKGKLTKSGKQTYKYINEKNKIKDYLPETAKRKGYKLAKKDDINGKIKN